MVAEKGELATWPDVSIPKSASILTSNQVRPEDSVTKIIADQVPVPAWQKEVHGKQPLGGAWVLQSLVNALCA